MHEVTITLQVKEASNPNQAVDMAVEYFCGGNYSAQVTQDVEVRELPDVQNSEADEA